MDPAVVAYLRELDHPLKRDIEAVRRSILNVSTEIHEGIKWRVPSFRTSKEYFATFNVRSTDSVQLVLHLGAKIRPKQERPHIADPTHLIKWLAKDRCMLTLGSGRDIAKNRDALELIVRAWIEHV